MLLLTPTFLSKSPTIFNADILADGVNGVLLDCEWFNTAAERTNKQRKKGIISLNLNHTHKINKHINPLY